MKRSLIFSLTICVLFVSPVFSKMESGIATAVDDQWKTVALQNSYATPVVVCSIHYQNNSIPVVTRVRNAAGNSFDLKLQNPSGSAIVADEVHYIVIEQGAWQLPDGRMLEANRIISTGTNYKNAWDLPEMASCSYLNSYTNPVVLGQVMTANDTRWSAFWSRAASQRQSSPTASICYVGKQVTEDSATTRVAETLGVIVIEQGSGDLGGIEYNVQVGPETIAGIGDAPPYQYSLSLSNTPAIAIAIQAAMVGLDGSWAYLYGSNPLSAASIVLAVDEDQITDAERAHAPEKISYITFQSAFNTTLSPVIPPVDPPFYSAAYEPTNFTSGPLHHQDGWSAGNNVFIQDAAVLSGSFSAMLTTESAILKTFDEPSQNVSWIEFVLQATASASYPVLTTETMASCGIFIHDVDGLVGLDGDGAGSGSWTPTNYLPDTVSKISLRMDYQAQSWSAFLNGNRVLADLGFKDSADKLTSFSMQSGQEGPMLLDDFCAGAENSKLMLYEISPLLVQFDETAIGAASFKTITLLNLDDLPLDFDAQITGIDAARFSIQSGLPLAALQPGNNAQVTLSFNPSIVKSHTAVLEITVSGIQQFTIPLRGDSAEQIEPPGNDLLRTHFWNFY